MKSGIGSLFILLALGAVLSYARPNMELQREAEGGIRVRREIRIAESLLTVEWEGIQGGDSSIRGFIVEYRAENESEWHVHSGVIPYKGPNHQYKVQIPRLPTGISYVVRIKVLGEKNEVLVVTPEIRARSEIETWVRIREECEVRDDEDSYSVSSAELVNAFSVRVIVVDDEHRAIARTKEALVGLAHAKA